MTRLWAAFLALPLISAINPAVAAPKVVASIIPIHSLTASIMQGVAEPQLLVPAGASPHTYALKPSDARALESANLVIWVGEALENYLEKPLGSLAGKARTLEIADFDDLTLLDAREGGAFEPHDHDEAPARPYGYDKKLPTIDGAPKGHVHAEDEKDLHLWLSPANARIIAAHIATELATLDPANAPTYRANDDKLNERLAALEQTTKARLAPVQDRPYIVFHDAYQYYERAFGTRIVGSITVSPDQTPGAKRIADLRERIRTTAPVCIFREPQFNAPIIDTLVSGTNVKIGVLDPEGANMTPGADAYFLLMDRIANSLATCLAPST